MRVCHPEHKLNDSIPQFLWISKAPEQHIKQRYNICDAAVHGIACVPPLQLATHPGSQVSSLSSRRGTLRIRTKCIFFCTSATFSFPAAGLFSRSRLRRTQRARLHTRCKCWSRAGTVASALRVLSRELWQVIAGSVSAEIKPSKIIANPHVHCFAPLP